MEIKYFRVSDYTAFIDIEDVGNCCIEANSDTLMYWYIIIKTTYGQAEIYTNGPTIPDLKILPDKVTTTYEKLEFDQRKILKMINTFLNDPKKEITQAKIISFEEGFEKVKSITEFMKNNILSQEKEDNDDS